MAISPLIPLVFAILGVGVQPDKPEPPFTVFVAAAASGDAQKDKDLIRAGEELSKQLTKRKKWFRSAAERESAEIVVEIESHSTREFLTFWASTETMGGETQGVGRSTISRNHFLQAKVTLLGEELNLRGVDARRNGSIQGAASALARELEKLCGERAGDLRAKRERPR